MPPPFPASLFASCLLTLAVLFAPSRVEAVLYTVSGNHILKDGVVWQIHGVARASYEWSPTGDGHFTQADMNTIAGWNANTVRIAFNESYMLSDSSCFDPNYLGRLDAAVTAANNAGLNVIFDLHWNTANTTGCATGQQNMADRRSLTAWDIMANRYKNNPMVFFELYNEPHNITWSVWRNGDGIWAGMQEMYHTVRAAGFDNLVLIGGLNWAFDLSGVPANRVTGDNIVYVTHPYDFGGKQPADWPSGFGFLTATDPVAATEFGAFNCTTGYVVSALNYFDAPEGDANRRMGWTGWAWNSPNSCGFPSIISDWTGGASTMGQPEKDRLISYGSGDGGGEVPSGVTMEAEAMTLANYGTESVSAASGGSGIKLSVFGATGTASYAFSGTTGTYDIKVWYFDENDGASPMKLFVNNVVVDSWTADQDLGSPDPVAATRTSRTIAGVSITNGATIKLQAVQNSQEWGRFDLVEVTALSAPPAPTGLSATAGNAQVSLSWNASANATSYNVKRSTMSGGPYSTIASPSSTSFTNTGLTNSLVYFYVVSAVNSVGESANSAQASATPSSGGTGTPPPSTGSGGSSSSGGGGALDAWFVGAVFLLSLIRRIVQQPGPTGRR